MIEGQLFELCTLLPATAHRAAFSVVVESMKNIGFTEKELEHILIILAAILLIGDIVSQP